MILKFINAFLMGIAFISLLTFLFFIGLKIHYFEYYGIKEYFNIIFVDNLNFYIYPLVAFFVGYAILYSGFINFFLKVYIALVFLSAASIYQPIGLMVGEKLFMQKDLRLKFGSIVFSADMLYAGREKIYLYRQDLAKMVTLDKSEVIILTQKQ
ncbi:MAG: isoleucyl-tRNA synthetase [Sulfurospirillum sp.]|nr:isoleucyl-tRNA synthetase [Sulfurospirillum sp.]